MIMVVIPSWLLYRYAVPKGWREWSRAGLVQAFVIPHAGPVRRHGLRVPSPWLGGKKLSRRLALALLASSVCALAHAGEKPRLAAGDLVRKAVANELRAIDPPGHHMYNVRRETSKTSRTRAVIETAHWMIGRLIRIDDRPLGARARQEESERLQRLIRDPARLRQKEEELRQDVHDVRRFLEAFPDAFVFEDLGDAVAPNGKELVRLGFRANSSFDPPSRKLKVLSGMQGTMLIDPSARRIVRIEATLVRSVKFGWGVMGHVDSGGRFLLEQRDLGDGRWEVARLEEHFKGRVLLLKKIRTDLVMTTSRFRRMGDDLTLLEGLKLLESEDEMTGDGPTDNP